MTVLRSIRENLGFSAADVAKAAGWNSGKLAEIENSTDIDVDDAVVLGDLYGLDIGDAVERGAADLPPVAALLRGEGTQLSVTARFEICEATTVARTVRSLQGLLGEPTGWDLIARFKPNADYSHPRLGTPDLLAEQVRKHFRLAGQPVFSVMDQLFTPLGILVLSARLADKVDAFCFATPETGAVVVVNEGGEHAQSAFGRRITWAHELCHLLFDRPRMHELTRFCAFTGPRTRPRRAPTDEEAIEQRARAFAACLLAPTPAVRAVWSSTRDLPPNHRVRHVMDSFGLGFWAARARLENAVRLPYRTDISAVEAPPSLWERADPAPALNRDALDAGVSPLRAGALLEILLRAYEAGAIAERSVRATLRVDVMAWHSLRTKLGFPAELTYRAASAQDWPAD